MKTLAIDPGYGRCGIAIVSGSATKQVCEFSDCIETKSSADFPDRLAEICAVVREQIAEFNPDALAIERLFFNQNTTTAMKVAQVKGAIILEATRANMEIFEYTPQDIKTAVAGYGSAPKGQVMQMITQLVSMREAAKHDDEYDAVAVGITCLAHES